MNEELRQKNISNSEAVEILMENYVRPNVSIALNIFAYGFQNGYGEGFFKEIPHFAIGLLGISKRWTCYLLFEDEVPPGDLVFEAVNEANSAFKKFKRPMFKKNQKNVRRMLIIKRPKTLANKDFTDEQIF